MNGVLILAGQTASGKSALAVDLARAFGAEIVGADSRQIYRGMSVGTAAPTAEQRAVVPHHLIEFLDPNERYSAAQFCRDAVAAIDRIQACGSRALVVGGTGFYVRALCGETTLSAAHDPQVRARLLREAQIHPPQTLHDWLKAIDPDRAATLEPGDRYRVMRALEIALVARRNDTAPLEVPTLASRGIPYLKCYLEIDRSELARRIECRVDAMLANGLLEEAARLGDRVVAADAVGYPQALAYLRGWSTEPELRQALIRATRRYAKRQATWFRSERDLIRVPSEQGYLAVASLARELPGWN